MADTKIEWCDKSWNPIAGCSKCSPGCLNCYAERMAKRLYWMGMAKPATLPEYMKFENGWKKGHIELCEHRLNQPFHWRKPRRIFVCSMSDLFHEKVPFEFILKMVGITIATPWHTYLILTKRPKRMHEFFACWPDGWFIREGMKYSTFSNEFFAIDSIKEILPDLSKANDYWKNNYDQSKRGKLDGPVSFPQPNLHLGVSISNQAEADEKIPILLQIPAAVRFVSLEPLLEWIDLPFFYSKLNWVIVGAESGPKKRDCNIDWITGIVNQCKFSNIPVFVKQININGKVVKMPKEFPQELPERR